MPKKIVQDDERENYMIDLFGLDKGIGREDVDASLGHFKFELKSTSKGSVSTARDLGYKHLEKWKDVYWIIGNFTNHNNGFEFHDFYLLNPTQMQPWLEKIKNKIYETNKIGEIVINAARLQGIEEEILEKATKVFYDGSLLNDPNIPKNYIKLNGTPITENYNKTLRTLLNYGEEDNASNVG